MYLDGYLDEHDSDVLLTMTGDYIESISGDTNLDGIVNVVDIIAVLNQIIGEDSEVDANVLAQFDVNGDGLINVVDIVALVQQIIEGE